MATDKKRTNAAAWAWTGEAGQPGTAIAKITWADGVTDEVKVAAFSDEVYHAAAQYGLEQKLRDAYALPAREVDGKTVYPTVAEKRDAMRATLDHLLAGQWNAPRGEGEPRSYVFLAMQRLYPERNFTRESFDALVEKAATQKECKPAKIIEGMRENPRVKAEIEKIKAERGVKSVDVSDVLDGIEGL